ncbi:hypothetical protein D4739_04570 [Nocardioides cavernaquae]|uniref:Uncharacterized protein n=2 Tax=Nocardioides cavernaquae TaxID=2321396 RepID=A0A3A5H4C8_9ACTN|nr:hypothetical protein D4739_04570 [Nocardioides cavernaquae]
MEMKDKTTPESDWDPIAHHHAPGWMTVAVILGIPYLVAGLLYMNSHASSIELLTPFGAIDYLAQIFLWPLYMIGLLPF